MAYEVTVPDLYAGMAEIKEEFDFSAYPKCHFLKSLGNMKVVGKFKDECHGQLMFKFVGLRPKLYSYDYEREVYLDDNGIEVKESTSMKIIVRANKNTGKGIKVRVCKRLSCDDYEHCLRQLEPVKPDHHREIAYREIADKGNYIWRKPSSLRP